MLPSKSDIVSQSPEGSRKFRHVKEALMTMIYPNTITSLGFVTEKEQVYKSGIDQRVSGTGLTWTKSNVELTPDSISLGQQAVQYNADHLLPSRSDMPESKYLHQEIVDYAANKVMRKAEEILHESSPHKQPIQPEPHYKVAVNVDAEAPKKVRTTSYKSIDSNLQFQSSTKYGDQSYKNSNDSSVVSDQESFNSESHDSSADNSSVVSTSYRSSIADQSSSVHSSTSNSSIYAGSSVLEEDQDHIEEEEEKARIAKDNKFRDAMIVHELHDVDEQNSEDDDENSFNSMRSVNSSNSTGSARSSNSSGSVGSFGSQQSQQSSAQSVASSKSQNSDGSVASQQSFATMDNQQNSFGGATHVDDDVFSI